MHQPTISQAAELTTTVREEHLIRLGDGVPGAGEPVPVYSTPAMILLMELAARKALFPFLEPGEEQVGVTVNITHTGPAQPGDTVRAVATITAVEGRQVDFQVKAFQGADPIGEGTHRRTVIKLEKLRQRLQPSSTTSSPAVSMPDSALSSTETEPPSRLLPQTKSFRWLELHHEEAILEVRLNRPDKRNAINRELAEEFAILLQWLPTRFPEIRVVLLTGNGGHFSAGNDVSEMASLSTAEARLADELRAANCRDIRQTPQPWVAALEGAVIGGGLMLAIGADFRVAAHNAFFSLPEISLGWPPAYGNHRLAELIGANKLAEMTLLGERIGAAQALESGLVTRLVAANHLLPEARLLARKLAAQPPQALSATRQFPTALPTTAEALDARSLEAALSALDTPEARASLARYQG